MSFRRHIHPSSLCHSIGHSRKFCNFVLGGLCQEAYSADLLGFRLLGLLQLDDLPTLIGKSQFMAEPFALANDGLSLGFTFLVELVYILDRAPVAMCRVSPSPKKPFSMPLQASSPTCPLCSGVTGRPDIFCCLRTRKIGRASCRER